jgi:UPF0716 family protein affecting phage T7 exclusion
MRVFVIALVIGIIEIVAISKLHQEIGLLNSIYLYVVGTCIGGLLLYMNWNDTKAQLEELGNFDESLIKRLKNKQNINSKDDERSVRVLFQSMLFGFAIVFVCIPGIVSDTLGILLAPLSIRSKLSSLLVNAGTEDGNA